MFPYRQKHTPLPDDLRLYLSWQVDHHLTPAELLTPPGKLRLVRLLHVDACQRCAESSRRLLTAADSGKLARGGT